MRGLLTLCSLSCLLLVAACGRSEEAIDIDEGKAWETLELGVDRATLEADLPRLENVPIDPKPRVGEDYDPVFPPDLPFDESEWETGPFPPAVAVPEAKPGGKLRLSIMSWPSTIRTEGANSQSAFLSELHSLIYQPLLYYSATEEAYYPSLATHWKILPDKVTFRFRLSPKAKWADGRPVTADDVVATFEHKQNPDRKDPAEASYYRRMIEHVKALDRLTVEIKGRQPLWRTFLSVAAGVYIYPASYIRMDGQTYLKEWNWRLPPGSGPYELRSEDIKTGRFISLRRRHDWWQQDHPSYRGWYNFDTIEWKVVRDRELAYTKFLAGELDIYIVGRAQRWVEELDDVEQIRMGWVQRRRIFNKDPEGYNGFVFNMRKPPFDDRRIRLAFTHLFNREKLFGSFFFYQYEYVDSYFPGQDFARPDAERTHYDPDRARELLAEAGWIRKDEQGFLVNEKGERFPELTLEYGVSSWQRIHDVYRNELWDEAGIKLTMKLLDPITLSQKQWEYKFNIAWQSWTGVLYPSLEMSWHSANADRPRTRNMSGFKNAEVDEIIAKYRTEFDALERRKMLQRVDEILFETHPYALAWYGPNFRILYWDKFGHPPEYAARFDSHYMNLIRYWWRDEDREKRTLANRRAKEPNHPDRKDGQTDEIDQQYWLFNDTPMKDE